MGLLARRGASLASRASVAPLQTCKRGFARVKTRKQCGSRVNPFRLGLLGNVPNPSISCGELRPCGAPLERGRGEDPRRGWWIAVRSARPSEMYIFLNALCATFQGVYSLSAVNIHHLFVHYALCTSVDYTKDEFCIIRPFEATMSPRWGICSKVLVPGECREQIAQIKRHLRGCQNSYFLCSRFRANCAID